MDIKIERKKGIRPKHIIYLLIAGALIVIMIKIIFGDHASRYKVDRDKLTIDEVFFSDFKDYTDINGHVEPIKSILLDASESGRVKELLIEEGAILLAGDIILVLENQTLHQEILMSESQLAEKENNLRSTKINYESSRMSTMSALTRSYYSLQQAKRKKEQYEDLYKDKLVPKEEYLRAVEAFEETESLMMITEQRAYQDSLLSETTMKQLDIDLERMRATMKLVYARLEDLNVKAPIDGQLGRLDVEIGQNISRGSSIGQINVLSDFKIAAMIDEHYIDRIRTGLPASLERQGRLFELVIRKVYPEVRDGQFQIDLVFTTNRPDNIRTGQSFFINLELGQSKSALLLKKGAFFNSTGGQWAFVVDKGGESASKRMIRIGQQNPEYYEILDGLLEGDQIISSGYGSFGNAEKIVFK
ncbi:MAG: efflux RND transporter periplasmic adaptor subunit [Bacteroidetes bacterium]|nr:efflux RND transporter periplasmic adaptor subunit [Bacteroidota bacterium]MBT3748506.1 efflux RND transporter periplasmic adaptor subunit [Bacteroidota bacterium]MBT4410852.1 efflux RND transporter periplasmic adaptor subunit [Bacteroidota bacterium]MBT7093721.1 efflux RND transporter periplasmic adaptor subunit [Bacteroidota bacterium]MBT7464375.1 efflux RND transporter periplasmic adaptor subunit [Bacteroidota bacterium]